MKNFKLVLLCLTVMAAAAGITLLMVSVFSIQPSESIRTVKSDSEAQIPRNGPQIYDEVSKYKTGDRDASAIPY